MKRHLLAAVAALGLLAGAVSTAAAQANPPQAAAEVSHECEGGAGQGTVTVRGEVKSTQTVPAEGSRGRGPCPPA
jgi:opacity protein-like surface antigen